MTYQTIEQINGTGIPGILQTASQAVPILPGLILGALFTILAFASYYATQRRLGRGDMPSSFAVSGFVTVVVALLMTLVEGFITNATIVPVVALEIIFAIWLFFSKE